MDKIKFPQIKSKFIYLMRKSAAHDFSHTAIILEPLVSPPYKIRKNFRFSDMLFAQYMFFFYKHMKARIRFKFVAHEQISFRKK